jgi:hypothetical protein
VLLPLSSSHGVGAARPDFSLPLRFLFSSSARQLSRSPRFGCSLAQHRTAPGFPPSQILSVSFLSACGSILLTESAGPISLVRRLPVEQPFFVSSGGFTSAHGFLALRQPVFLVDLLVSSVLSLATKLKAQIFLV